MHVLRSLEFIFELHTVTPANVRVKYDMLFVFKCKYNR